MILGAVATFWWALPSDRFEIVLVNVSRFDILFESRLEFRRIFLPRMWHVDTVLNTSLLSRLAQLILLHSKLICMRRSRLSHLTSEAAVLVLL